MTFTRVILALACLMSGTLVAQEAKVTQLLSKDLTSLPGKEGLMITVEYPPGSSDPIHRHNAYAQNVLAVEKFRWLVTFRASHDVQGRRFRRAHQ
jgi:hypothetical protein